jgi:hypothetical protein
MNSLGNNLKDWSLLCLRVYAWSCCAASSPIIEPELQIESYHPW